ncbi:MAG: 2-oxoacid:ferredoxin oxidoreductase subunit alpha, partial [Candidatus Micrarchaeia archaeon]
KFSTHYLKNKNKIIKGVFIKINWMIGGVQGIGIDTAALIFGDSVAKAGYYLFGSREYYSTIKNRHSYTTVKISDAPSSSINNNIEVLIATDAETIFQHFTKVKDFIIYDKKIENTELNAIRSMENEIIISAYEILSKNNLGSTCKDAIEYTKKKGVRALGIDYNTILQSIMNQLNIPSPLTERAKTMIGVGASFKLLGLSFDLLSSTISSRFKDPTIAKLNVMAAKSGYDSTDSFYNLKALDVSSHRIEVDGNTASAIGKMLGGLKFQSYYPITPASDESTYIEANQNLILNTSSGPKNGGVVVYQTEDELAAINAAIGSALTGARSATATSGPGFSLMAEGISWAGMNEVPVVITYYLRGAPSTGLPTRSGQSDLMFALNVGHGEFPRIVIASSNHYEIINDAITALNLAERYQTPVIHLIEKSLANAYAVIDEDKINADNIIIDRGEFTNNTDASYRRFKFNEDGVSARAPLGNAAMFYSGDEHNEYGHIDETSSNRVKMYEKRNKKLELAMKEIEGRYKICVNGDKNAEYAIITWGSGVGPSIECIDRLKKEGINMQVVQIKMFNPYPSKEVSEILKNKKRIIAVENNYNAQGAEVMQLNTGIKATDFVLKWTGRAIADDELFDALVDIIKNNKNKVVLNDEF